MKKNNLTELVFILDRSGSMFGSEEDTIGGFNSMLEQQKREEGRVLVTTILFNDHQKMVHDRCDLGSIPHMTRRDYVPQGCTALLDTLGGAIRHIAGVHKYARPEDRPDHTLFVIITDGMENASHTYRIEEVREMLEHEKEKYGWEFLFLGANMDAVATAQQYGIEEDRAVTYSAQDHGHWENFQVCSEAILRLRQDECIGRSWKQKIEDRER